MASTTLALPKLIALKSNYNHKYLRYIKVVGYVDGFLQFSGDEVASRDSTFEVEMAKSGEGLVHIKFCHNNKYWVRQSEHHWWIVAGADKPEEDQSKWSCTLFKPIFLDEDGTTVRFMHVQLEHYLKLWRTYEPPHDCLYAGSKNPTFDVSDVFTVIDLAVNRDNGDSGEKKN